ncbi:hypothetical protein, partial [Escherichia coli]
MEQINSNKKHSNRRKYFSLLAVVLFICDPYTKLTAPT